MKKILVLMVCLTLFSACKKQDWEHIKIPADLDFIKKYKYEDGEKYITYIPKHQVEEPYWAEIVVDDSAKIAPKSKITKYLQALPAFRYCENPFLQIINATVIFDDERINLPYRCIDVSRICIDINNCIGINDDAHYMYCDAHCVAEPSQVLAKKIFDSRKYCIEIEYKMKNNKHIKGRWFFGDWQKE